MSGVDYSGWMKPEDTALQDMRIIAVDDEESNLLLVRRILERARYTRTEFTRDPTAVPAMFLESRPDLVVLDLQMRGWTGTS